jgi:hypothetical protein
MKKITYTLTLILAICFTSYAQYGQIESLAGPRLGMVFIAPGIAADIIHEGFGVEYQPDQIGDQDYIDPGSTGYAMTSLYGWQWEMRFADGGDITGIVEWVALVGGMEKGLFLPSVSSLVGARTASGFEFAMGPNLSLSGFGMVFGAGYNFKAGDLNLPVNIAFVPGVKRTIDRRDYQLGTETELQTTTGSRFSITLGFNLGR